MSSPLRTLPSAELLARVSALLRRDCHVEADWLAHLGEVDARRLYLDEGCPSMFVWCQRVLHFAEGVAYKRIQAARAARRYPELLGAVRAGALHLTAVSLLAPHLTSTNCAELIAAARHRSAEEIRRLLADRAPKPSLTAQMRKVATPRMASALPHADSSVASAIASPTSVASDPQASLSRASTSPDPCTQAAPARTRLAPAAAPQSHRPEPLGGQRYCVRFTADRETHAQLEELRALMRHQVPDGDLGEILSRAVALLHEQVRRRKFGEVGTPRGGNPSAEKSASPSRPAAKGASPRGDISPPRPAAPSRHIPAAIRRAVYARDDGRCSYVSPKGQRCGAREFLEYDHREAWARRRDHTVEGITLRCRAHNQQRARRDFGERHMQRFAGPMRRAQLDPDQVGAEPPRQGSRGR